MKVLERRLGVAPAVVAAAAVEVDEPESLHFDAHVEDRLGPLHDHLLVLGGVAFVELVDPDDGFGSQPLHVRKKPDGVLVGEDSLTHAHAKLYSTGNGLRRCAKTPPAFSWLQNSRRIPMPVEERVKSIIVEQLGVDAEEVTLDASFVEDLGADSLDTVELLMAFEEEFGVEISDDEAEKIRKVRDAVDYIEKRAKAQ